MNGNKKVRAMTAELKDWADYINQLDGRQPNPKLSTFYARYNFAINFVDIEVNGMAHRTLSVYSAVTKLAFSYAALESIEGSLKLGNLARIEASDLAAKARAVMPKGISGFENRMYLNNVLKERLITLFEDETSSDVRPLVEQFRHSLFHGKFTPSGWGLKGGQVSLELLEGLAQVTLRKADDTFTQWFKSQAKN
jgi:hypothetical protein